MKNTSSYKDTEVIFDFWHFKVPTEDCLSIGGVGAKTGIIVISGIDMENYLRGDLWNIL